MGGFFYGTKRANNDFERVRAESRDKFEQSGLGPPVAFDTDAFFVDYYPKRNNSGANYVRFPGGDFIIAVGTFIYRGEIGERALRLFFATADHAEALHACRGHFALIVRKSAQTRLLKDLAGSYEVFLTHDSNYLSTSFLAALSATKERTINIQEAYEYVFNGVALGVATPIAEVRRLALFEEFTFEPTPASVVTYRNLCPTEAAGSMSELGDANLQKLLGYAADLVKLFGDNISVALSGGYDSRFLVALFRHCGANPHIFVYGSRNDPDVMVAARIAKLEGFDLHHVDKTRARSITLDTYAEIVRTNYLSDDALPAGGIFVNGAELDARRERNKNGALHVNGGGGEVYRNFFNLLNRRLTPREFVWIFYSRYDPTECTGAFEPEPYEETIGRKAAALFGTGEADLSRRQIECLYPYFRCRSWFGRENSVNNRWGYSVLPFFDFQTIDQALKVPVRFKYFGNFESYMIRRADASLARHDSNYGHNFSKGAPYSTMATDLFTYLRPAWARRHSFRLKTMMEKSTRSVLLSKNFLDRAIDTKFPYMSRFFKIAEVKSELQFARICTLEYFFNEVSAQ